MSEPFIGQVSIFGGNFAPRGWAFCAGQVLAISQNTALFSLIGTFYGGDGRTTFGIPDLRGRSVVGAGNGPGLTPRNPGNFGGSESVVLNSTDVASHQHGMTSATVAANNPTADINVTAKLRANSGTDGDVNNPGTNSVLGATPNEAIYVDQDPDTDMRANSISASASITNVNIPIAVSGQADSAGGGSAHNNMAPFLTTNYIIALQGLYPSRS